MIENNLNIVYILSIYRDYLTSVVLFNRLLDFCHVKMLCIKLCSENFWD